MINNNELIEPTREFNPSTGNLFAGLILGILLLVGGGYVSFLSANEFLHGFGHLPFMAEKGKCWGPLVLFFLLGIGLMVGGGFMFRWMRSLSGLRVLIGGNGFVTFSKTESHVFLWSKIASVQETHLFERPPLLKGAARVLMPTVTSKGFLVRRKDNQEFRFDGNTIRDHLELAEMIKKETDPQNILWIIVEEHS